RAGGELWLNEGAVENYHLKEYEGGALFFEEETSILGIQPTNNKSKITFRSWRSCAGGGVVVDASKFCEVYEIPTDVTSYADVIGQLIECDIIIASLASIMPQWGRGRI
ncbi:hypothetical protein KGY71_00160, partial [Candidatus Bipolaricaulota bacterium]|nr:hypothetical protein [Candidatus Bipolaricaulota bacterium]